MSSTAAILGLAGQNLAQGRARDALRLLDQALIDLGGERGLHALRAQALYALGDQRAAAGAMAALVSLSPADAESLLAMGLFLDAVRADQSAEMAYRHARAARPGFSRPALAQALMRLRAGDLKVAFDLIKASGIGTSTPERVRLEARVCDALREAMVERRFAIEALSMWPNGSNSPLVLQASVDCAVPRMNFEAAAQALKRLSQLRSDWPLLASQQAMVDFRTGDWTAVIRTLGMSMPPNELVPQQALLRALALARIGDGANARRQLEQMVESTGLDETDYRAARLFLALAALGDDDAEPATRIDAEVGANGTGGRAFVAAMSTIGALRYPGFNRLYQKIDLHHAITGYAAAKGHGAFPYYPETYVLPDDANELARALPGRWIVKPAEPGGSGVLVLAESPSDFLSSGPSLVQRLVERPLLVNGRLACVSLFLVLPSPDIGRALIFDDGIVHFAPEPSLPHADDINALQPTRIITSAHRHKDYPGLDPFAGDGEPWAGIWSLRAYLSEVGRFKGVRVAGTAWSGFVHLARDVARLSDYLEILDAQRAAPAPWSYPPTVLRLECIMDEDFKAHFIGIADTSPVDFPAAGTRTRVDDDITLRMTRALVRLVCVPAQQAALGFTALNP